MAVGRDGAHCEARAGTVWQPFIVQCPFTFWISDRFIVQFPADLLHFLTDDEMIFDVYRPISLGLSAFLSVLSWIQ